MTGFWKRILAVVAALLILVLFLCLPKQPKSVRNAEKVEFSAVDQKISKGVQLVKEGLNPMAGIQLLREVLEEDSTNAEAHLWLGMFSIESGQREKARERFDKVIEYHPENPEAYWQLGQMDFDEKYYLKAIPNFQKAYEIDSTYSNGLFFIGKSHEFLGNKKKAVEYYNSFLPLTTDTIISNRVEEMIINLNNEF